MTEHVQPKPYQQHTDKFVQTIELLLIRSASRAKETNLPLDQLYIVTSRDPAALKDAQITTTAPSDISSPFTGLELSALREEHRALFGVHSDSPANKFAYCTFIVLDERSVKDESCQLVSCSVDKGEARSDFYLPIEVLTAVEMGSSELNEGMRPEEWQDPQGEGMIFYEVEKWEKFMGH